MRVVTRSVVDPTALETLLRPRHGLVAERAVGRGHFNAASGPVASYQRTVEVEPLGDGRASVIQTLECKLAVPYFGFVFVPLFRRSYGRLTEPSRMPWWAPPERFDARAATVLGAICVIAMVTGYLGTLFTRTITFAADDFGAAEGSQGMAGTAVRIGGVLALVVVAAADRRGRRLMLLIAAAAGCLLSATGALAPSLAWLTGTQVMGRACASALVVLLAIVAAEEMPAGSRAYAISLITMASALGAGFCILALPLADLGESSWRAIYVLALAGVPLTLSVARRLPETRRFVTPHPDSPLAGHGARLWLLASAGFLTNLMAAPASFFENRYLSDELGFSAARITLLTVATSTPGAIGIVIGGRLADTKGRRLVGAVATATSAIFGAFFYLVSGWPLWACALTAAILTSAAVPALGVYGPELFPTSLRGRANGLILVASLVGGSVGLLTVGFASEAMGRFGPVMAALAVGPLILSVLIWVAYPETAHRELEELNPEDRPASPSAATGLLAEAPSASGVRSERSEPVLDGFGDRAVSTPETMATPVHPDVGHRSGDGRGS